MSTSTQQLHSQFVPLLPRIELHARFVFRLVRCAVQKADCIAECIALCWKWFLRLARQGKDASRFVGTLAAFAARAVKSGRQLGGQQRANDVLSPYAQRRHGFQVESLASERPNSAFLTHPHGQTMLDAFEERLKDNDLTPIPDQVAFRIDWPQFFASLTPRDRQLAEYLALGHSGKHASAKFGVSPGRITQLRQRWCLEWHQFQEADVLR